MESSNSDLATRLLNSIGILNNFSAELLCEIFKEITHWSDIKKSIKNFPQFEPRLIDCVTTIDFLDGKSLVNSDYSVNMFAKAYTAPAINKILSKFSRIERFYAKILFGESATGNNLRENVKFLIKLIKDDRVQELDLILTQEFTKYLTVDWLVFGLRRRLEKYGSDFILICNGDDMYFSYVRGVLTLSIEPEKLEGIIRVFHKYPGSVKAILNSEAGLELNEFLNVSKIWFNFGDNSEFVFNSLESFIPEVVTEIKILGKAKPLRVGDFILAEILYMIEPNEDITVCELPVQEEYAEMFKQKFPNVKAIYYPEHFYSENMS